MTSRGRGSVTGNLGADMAGIAAEDDDAVGDLHRLLDIVRDEDDAFGRHAPRDPEVHKVAAERLRRQHVERREGLVEQQHVGIDHQRAGESDALPHAARELLGIGRLEPVETDEIDRLQRPLPPLGTRHALRLQAELDIAEHGEPGKEREGLEHHGDAVRRAVDDVAAIGDAALGGRREAGDDAQKGRFAGARLAEDGDDLAFLQREVDMVEDQSARSVGGLVGLADLLRGNETAVVGHEALNPTAAALRREYRDGARPGG